MGNMWKRFVVERIEKKNYTMGDLESSDVFLYDRSNDKGVVVDGTNRVSSKNL